MLTFLLNASIRCGNAGVLGDNADDCGGWRSSQAQRGPSRLPLVLPQMLESQHDPLIATTVDIVSQWPVTLTALHNRGMQWNFS
eukprot:2118283-Rhodomonas_salina.1